MISEKYNVAFYRTVIGVLASLLAIALYLAADQRQRVRETRHTLAEAAFRSCTLRAVDAHTGAPVASVPGQPKERVLIFPCAIRCSGDPESGQLTFQWLGLPFNIDIRAEGYHAHEVTLDDDATQPIMVRMERETYQRSEGTR